jgi:excinuclease ABC subunit A
MSKLPPATLDAKTDLDDLPIQTDEYIDVVGAAENNLRAIDIKIPREQLVVITGISGSGKSSLAFDTIYAEGQRRYMETFSSYARQFMGSMERPEVEKIDGLSPVISIEQKTTSRNPRSTVGTVTEIYDFLRLLFARAGDAYSYETGERMVRYTEDQIIATILEQFDDKKIALLAPLVRGRKGHYRELFEQMRKQGYSKVRADGEVLDLEPGLQVDRYKVHNIELVVDRIKVGERRRDRLSQSLQTAMTMGNDLVFVEDVDSGEILPFSKALMDPKSGLSYEEPSPNTFSFNSPYGACPDCRGLGEMNAVDLDKVMPDKSLSINAGGLKPLGEKKENLTFKQLAAIAKTYKFKLTDPLSDIPEVAMKTILYGGDREVKMPKGSKYDHSQTIAEEGLTNQLLRYYRETTSEKLRQWAEDYMVTDTCPTCEGYRLRKESLHFKLAGQHIGELSHMDVVALQERLEEIENELSERQLLIAGDVLKEIGYRLGFLIHVGLTYLSLDRSSKTLSGGESQRIRLATQIGSQLTGITYILDEPSIGLHQRDNEKLIQALMELRDIGNSVLVVEHDKDIMLASDYLIDLGPGAGSLGGEVMAEGKPAEFLKKRGGLGGTTAMYLRDELQIELPAERRKGNGHKLSLKQASGHNLQHVDVEIPLGTFVCVTGVSGSGKSSLINETLYPVLRQHFYKSLQRPLPHKSLTGLEHLDKVIEIDQSPIGRTPRSNPATYTGVFTDIRKLFSDLPEAKIRGYKPGRFSFNVEGGRCPDCKGSGLRVIEMNFLPDVQVECETCMGRRYNRETLEILYKGKSINDVLNMTVKDAAEFFQHIPKISRRMRTLADVGLGYITLGQQATTISGGEAQRVKLAEELSKRDTGNTIYILDEPTTGLHFQDIKHLLVVLDRLVAKGNTVVVIEHSMDVIKMADYIIDVGPEGGSGGGMIVAAGTPEEVAVVAESHTGRFLIRELGMKASDVKKKSASAKTLKPKAKTKAEQKASNRRQKIVEKVKGPSQYDLDDQAKSEKVAAKIRAQAPKAEGKKVAAKVMPKVKKAKSKAKKK